jgi:hypothetical protein
MITTSSSALFTPLDRTLQKTTFTVLSFGAKDFAVPANVGLKRARHDGNLGLTRSPFRLIRLLSVQDSKFH